LRSCRIELRAALVISRITGLARALALGVLFGVLRHMRELSPELFKAQHYTLTEHELHLSTNDQDRVKRAWQYIYSNGCIGK
jgi:hypothetical protein